MTDPEVQWDIQPLDRRHLRVTAKGTSGLAKIHARWFVAPGAVPQAPWQVTISRAGRAAGEQRGVTSGVLRDAEPLVVRMTAELPEQLSGHDLPDPMKAIEERASALPDSPRGNQSYYKDLLAIFDAIEAAGLPDPVKALCRVTGKAEGTIKTQLRVARRGGLIRPSEVDGAQ